jgi:hypothetical protein
MFIQNRGIIMGLSQNGFNDIIMDCNGDLQSPKQVDLEIKMGCSGIYTNPY